MPRHGHNTMDTNALYVLLVEDNPVNLKLAKRILEKLGCRVDTAENGAVGVRMCAANRYDVVFMDCQMPVMDGWEATRCIRTRRRRNRALPSSPSRPTSCPTTGGAASSRGWTT